MAKDTLLPASLARESMVLSHSILPFLSFLRMLESFPSHRVTDVPTEDTPKSAETLRFDERERSERESRRREVVIVKKRDLDFAKNFDINDEKDPPTGDSYGMRRMCDITNHHVKILAYMSVCPSIHLFGCPFV